MRTMQVKVYQYGELSEKAREKARQWYRDATAAEPFPWADDCMESLEKLAEHFGGKLADYSIDWYGASYSSARFEMPEDLEDADIEARLAGLGDYDNETLKGHGDCVLTGYCADESAIDGFRKAYSEGERDLEDLMQAAFREWLQDAQSDAQAGQEDEAIQDAIEANGYEFYADGRRAVV